MKVTDDIRELKAELGLDAGLQINSASSAAAHYWSLKNRGNSGMQYVSQKDYMNGQQRLWGGNIIAWEADMLKLIKQNTGCSYHYLLANSPEPIEQVGKPAAITR